jgi:hypothetical protein
MKAFACALVLAAGFGCMEPPQTNKIEDYLSGLADLHTWDKDRMGKGLLSFDAVMGWGPEIWPQLINRLTDDTPTKIYDEMSGRTAKISDVVFLMLLELFHKRWQDFSADGVFVSTALPNPVFCIKWDRPAKFKVKAHFLELLAQEEASK